MRTKNIFIIIMILLLYIININAEEIFDGNGLTSLDKKRWNVFVKNIKCKLYSNVKYVVLKKEKFPVLIIELEYIGSENYTLQWDNDFSRVLWKGDFILESKIGNDKDDTSDIKYKTSNTYEPGQSILIKKGSVLKSTLDFKKMPGTYAQNLFKKGILKLRLYAKEKNGNEKLVPLSNKLIINVR